MINKTDSQDFFTPRSFYNLNSAGLGVWLTCLVIGSVFTDITSFWFRLIALGFSLIVALSLFVKNKSWHKPYNYILIVVNAALIFINASGYNSITSSSPFERLKYKANDSSQIKENLGSFLNFDNQKDWWPDRKILNELDSLEIEIKVSERKYEGLRNQISFLKDWINTGIIDKKSRDTLKQILQNFGTYEVDSTDLAFLKISHNEKTRILNKRIDSLKQMIKIHESLSSSPYYTIDGKYMSADNWVDTLLERNSKLQYSLNFAKAYLKIDKNTFDSLLRLRIK